MHCCPWLRLGGGCGLSSTHSVTSCKFYRLSEAIFQNWLHSRLCPGACFRGWLLGWGGTVHSGEGWGLPGRSGVPSGRRPHLTLAPRLSSASQRRLQETFHPSLRGLCAEPASGRAGAMAEGPGEGAWRGSPSGAGALGVQFGSRLTCPASGAHSVPSEARF